MRAPVTLTGFVEPWIFERMSRMPAASRTARTEPPAMTPVPCEAGFRRTVLAPNWTVHLVGDRRADHRDPDQVLLRVLDALADGLRHLAGLAEPGTDVARAVTDDDDRAEAEPPAALDDLGDSIDLDDALLERELGWVDPCHVGSFRSEVEAGFAGGIGERLDPPVVPEPGSIEDDLLDAGGLGPLGDEPTDDGRLLGLGSTRSAKLLLRRRGRGERPAGRVVDDLGVDVVEAAEHREPRPRVASRRGAGGCRSWRFWRAAPRVASWVIGLDPRWSWITSCRRSCRPCRPCGGPARPRTGRPCPCTARACGCERTLAAMLADQLLVDADDGEAGRRLDLEADARGRVDLDRVAVAQVELELAAVERGTVARRR